MRIGIDIDDTITDTYEVIFNYAQRYNVEELKKSAEINRGICTSHHYTAFMHNWNKEETDNFWKKYYIEMIKKIKPKTFARDYIERLAKDNEIYFITARFECEGESISDLTKEWLERENIKYDKLIVNAEDKAEIAMKNAIDIFIDDSFDNCKSVSSKGIKTYIMDSRTNRNIDESKENFSRVYSWAHLYQELKIK